MPHSWLHVTDNCCMKQCGKCGEVKSFSEFYRSNSKKCGYGSYCKPCQHEHYKMRYNYRTKVLRQKWHPFKADYIRRNQRYVVEYLLRHPCVDRGEKDLDVLEFDHVRDVKAAGICQMVNRPASLDALIAEIAKCDVRCGNCHRRRTRIQMHWLNRRVPTAMGGEVEGKATEMLAPDLHPEYSCLVLRP